MPRSSPPPGVDDLPAPSAAAKAVLPAPPTLGALIRARRAQRRLTLQQLADTVGYAKTYLWLLERGRRTAPAPALLDKLERALAFDPGTLHRAAQWHATPPDLRRQLTHLQTDQRIARRLADILSSSGLDDQGRLKGALDRAHRSGELRRLVEAVGDPDPDPEEVKRGRGEEVNDPSSPLHLFTSSPLHPHPLPLQVPLINKVAAGYPADFTDLGYPARTAGEYVRAPAGGAEDPDAFAARVVGDSMAPDYREGDIVVFSPARPVRSGMDCFARLEPDHQTTFKRIYFETAAGAPAPEGAEESAHHIRLQPLNPAYPPRTLPREEIAGLYAAISITRAL